MEVKSASSFVVAPRCKKRVPVKNNEEPVQRNLKIQKKTFSQVVYYQRTSIPKGPKRIRRLSEIFQKLNLNLIVPPAVIAPDDDPDEGACEEDKMEVNVSSEGNSLGYPFLSSTKLNPSLDNDQLSNAVRLYGKQLKGNGIWEELEERKEMEEHVTSQIFHKNAMVTSFGRENTNYSCN